MRTYAYVAAWFITQLTVHAAPADRFQAPVAKRADNSAGIGVELEVREFILSNDNQKVQTYDEKMVAAVKGAQLVSLTTQDQHTCGQFWALTAELSGTETYTGRLFIMIHSRITLTRLCFQGISRLTFEWIINGQKLKMKKSDDPESKQDLVLPSVGTELKAATQALGPIEGQKFSIQAANYNLEDWDSWVLKKPSVYSHGGMNPGVQVTTGLPMEGTCFALRQSS